jgi:hypothetical protein
MLVMCASYQLLMNLCEADYLIGTLNYLVTIQA